ncbi:hypothetical protein HYPSUDRAFT_216184 [Hypholoma sublateritium FD-334 SS-4]|uniref:Uncharacterized protein n=1 Tax=Hypholoma sublateritium (strain FD-334 SS-4) TaxID=945553 RepID=A0A0D2NYV6_HYPSF|nr:hypothetical protein HYPSUDRAFT_216184 [Hypholoma sublateritium FD-334 SS-4]
MHPRTHARTPPAVRVRGSACVPRARAVPCIAASVIRHPSSASAAALPSPSPPERPSADHDAAVARAWRLAERRAGDEPAARRHAGSPAGRDSATCVRVHVHAARHRRRRDALHGPERSADWGEPHESYSPSPTSPTHLDTRGRQHARPHPTHQPTIKRAACRPPPAAFRAPRYPAAYACCTPPPHITPTCISHRIARDATFIHPHRPRRLRGYVATRPLPPHPPTIKRAACRPSPAGSAPPRLATPTPAGGRRARTHATVPAPPCGARRLLAALRALASRSSQGGRRRCGSSRRICVHSRCLASPRSGFRGGGVGAPAPPGGGRAPAHLMWTRRTMPVVRLPIFYAKPSARIGVVRARTRSSASPHRLRTASSSSPSFPIPIFVLPRPHPISVPISFPSPISFPTASPSPSPSRPLRHHLLFRTSTPRR